MNNKSPYASRWYPAMVFAIVGVITVLGDNNDGHENVDGNEAERK